MKNRIKIDRSVRKRIKVDRDAKIRLDIGDTTFGDCLLFFMLLIVVGALVWLGITKLMGLW